MNFNERDLCSTGLPDLEIANSEINFSSYDRFVIIFSRNECGSPSGWASIGKFLANTPDGQVFASISWINIDVKNPPLKWRACSGFLSMLKNCFFFLTN